MTSEEGFSFIHSSHYQRHSGIISLPGVTEDGASVEFAMAGHDSVIGFPRIVRKNETAFRAQAQIAGAALRVSAKVLQAAIKQES